MKYFKLFAVAVSLLLSCAAVNAFAAAASIFEMTGTVTATPGTAPGAPAAAPRTLRKGDSVEQGDVVATGANSSVVLRFEDGQVTALSANSRMAITTYAYNKTNAGAGNVLLSLLSGGMRSITGLIGKANPSKVAYKAGNATIGIRGTDVSFSLGGTSLVIHVTEGAVSFSVNGGPPQSLTVGQSAGVTNGMITVGALNAVLAAAGITSDSLALTGLINEAITNAGTSGLGGAANAAGAAVTADTTVNGTGNGTGSGAGAGGGINCTAVPKPSGC